MAKVNAGHDVRRREVSEVASRILARGGVDNLTVRALAAKAGYSTHVVSHYFNDKEDLLISTLRHVAARQVSRLKAAIKSGSDVMSCLEVMLPLDDERMVDARVWVVFWPYALGDQRYAEVSDKFGARWRHLMIGLLRLCGVITPETSRAERDLLGRQLQMIIAGISIHGALGVWSREEQVTILRKYVLLTLNAHRSDEACEPERSRSAKIDSMALPMSELNLMEENRRLRGLLIDAMLTVDQLNERLVRKDSSEDPLNSTGDLKD